MGPRKAGEGKTSPASSNGDQMKEGMNNGGGMKMSKGMVMLPLSMLEVNDGGDNIPPSEGDEVELSGVVQMVKNGVAHIKVNEAMMEGESESEASNEEDMSEEDKMRELAKQADEESYS